MARTPVKIIAKVEECESFGPFILVDGPSRNDMIVVLTWDSPGPLIPRDIRLRHQLYKREVEELLLKHEEVWVVPYKSAHRQKVGERA